MALFAWARRALNRPFRRLPARAVDGKLVNLGPGRGEAPVFGGDGAFRSLPYYTLDLTTVRARPGWLRALRVLHSKCSLCGAFVRARRALTRPKRWFPAPQEFSQAGTRVVAVEAMHAGGRGQVSTPPR